MEDKPPTFEVPKEPVNVFADPNKRIPKYCTNTLIQKLSNGHIIISFLQNDAPNIGEKASIDGAVLIERVLFDKDHIDQFLKAIKEVVEDPAANNE